MTVTTTYEPIVDFWAERGFEPKELYRLDGIAYWQIEVPDDHEMLTHPEYVTLAFQEKLNWHHVVRRRLQPKLYSVKKNGHYADVRDPEGRRAVPLARSRELLRRALTNPATGEGPDIIELKKPKKIRIVLDKAQRFGVDRIMFFAAEGFTESISLEEAMVALSSL
jgi:hypothetical protein